jgi:hypothetical protein
VLLKPGGLKKTSGVLQGSKHTNPAPTGFAVVELYTSEGCSSCPPADELLAKIAKEYKDGVYILGFHVDYWDRLGWKDRFSSHEYTQRQQQYASALKLNSIYTPQVIVNGKTEFTGSDENMLRKTLDSELKNTEGSKPGISAKATGGGNIRISYEVEKNEGKLLHIALVERFAEDDVKSGENSGHRLSHINIVRSFVTVSISKEKSGLVNLIMPANLQVKDCRLICFLQGKEDFNITGATIATID